MKALRVNDHTRDWTPDVPVRLYAGDKDTDVPIGNARTCARTLAGYGARVRVLESGGRRPCGVVRRGAAGDRALVRRCGGWYGLAAGGAA
ncbi:hypothetical protein ACIPSA_02645 [Streptomyces sp. NPDC086549]|uniref:hypothetical protein n=1 Tax=Streptomyces sp. NPDC086549 TaxID=3365752 RepID=UPI003828F013